MIREDRGELTLSDALPPSDSLTLEVSDLRVGAVAGRRIVTIGEGSATLTVRRGARTEQDTLVVARYRDSDSLIAVAVGSHHSCGIDGTRSVRCWGENWYGQVVPGHPTRGVGFAAARLVATPEPAVAIDAGPIFTCMLGLSGDAHCWGEDRDRQTLSPTSTSGIGTYRHAAPLVRLAVGTDHACALTSGGEAVCWGANRSGQLGVAPGSARAPTRVPGVPPLASIAAGTWYTCGITTDGQLWCWGGNIGLAIDPSASPSAPPWPRRIRATERFTQVDAGNSHTCAITTAGLLECWGRSTAGELLLASPTGVGADTTMRWLQVSAGASRTCGIAVDMRLYCAGSNEWGALGRGATATGTLPSLLNQPRAGVALGTAFDVSVGTGQHACALGFAGRPVCWGGNAIGQLGTGILLPDRETGLALSTLPVQVRFR